MNGLKIMRAELGMTQSELAAALHVSFTAVNRWENDRTRPNPAAFSILIRYARERGVSANCIEMMQSSFAMSRTRQNNAEVRVDGLPPIDRELLCQLVEEADTAVYVTDAETDEILYANHAVETAVGKRRDEMRGQKCYHFLAGRERPCPYCHKAELSGEQFYMSMVESGWNGRLYTARAKQIIWNGRRAHVRYVTAVDNDRLLSHVDCGVCIFTVGEDGAFALRYANESFCTQCGGEADDIYCAFRTNPVFAVAPSDQPQVRAFFRRVADEHSEGEMTYRARTLQGEGLWVLVRAAYSGTISGGRGRVYATFFDVSRSIANEVQLRGILAGVPAAIVVFEVRGDLLVLRYISESCKNITGFTAEETYRRNADGRAADAHPEAQAYFLAHEREDIDEKKNLSYTYPVLCKDGSYRYVQLDLARTEVDDRVLYHGSMRCVDYSGPQVILHSTR